jgi:NAD+ diphosphatase
MNQIIRMQARERSMMQMIHCMECGAKLTKKFLESEGKEISFCPVCKEFRFPVFNAAVSMIVTNQAQDKILLIRQYGRPRYILVAGYINQGEDAEEAVCREIREEVGLHVENVHFNQSHYYAPSNTLMLNFVAVVSDEQVRNNWEVDDYAWFSPEEARRNIASGSLAETFLLEYLEKSVHIMW